MVKLNPKNKTRERIAKSIAARRRAIAVRRLVQSKSMKWISSVRSRIRPSKLHSSNSNFNKKIYKFTLFGNENVSGRNNNSNRNGTNFNININVPKKNVFGNEYMKVNVDTLPLQSWIDAQINYIRGLNTYDFLTAMAYTIRSHEWITPYMYSGNYANIKFSKPRGISIVPLFPQIRKLIGRQNVISNTNRIIYEAYDRFSNPKMFVPPALMKRAMSLYIKDLHRIIKNAPPLPRTMVVYRGLDIDMFGGGMNTVQTMKSFASASYVPNNTYGPSKYMKITLPRGSRVLLLQCLNAWVNKGTGTPRGEYEILLNNGTRYTIQRRDLRRPVINSNKKINMRHVTDVLVYDTP